MYRSRRTRWLICWSWCLLLVELGGVQAQPVVIQSPDRAADFGTPLQAVGPYLLVGAPLDDEQAVDAGAVYVFLQRGDTWSFETKLTAPGGPPGSRFGSSLHFDGRTLAVGAPKSNDPLALAGAVYLFEPSRRGIWSHVATLQSDVPGIGSMFGRAVAVVGDTVVVGSSGIDAESGAPGGSVYLFARDAAEGWRSVQKISAPDRHLGFGSALYPMGKQVMVLAAQPNSFYAFGHERRLPFLNKAHPAQEDTFSTYHFAGVVYDSLLAVHTNPEINELHLLTQQAADTWAPVATFTAPNGLPGDGFGKAVAYWQDLLFVGAPNDDGPVQEVGSVYVYAHSSTGEWAFMGMLRGPGAYSHFGTAMTVTGDMLFVSAPGMLQDGRPSGTIYGYDLTQPLPFETLSFEPITDEETYLNESRVFPLLLDHEGLLWLGTLNQGLVRFDGYEAITHQHDPTDSTSITPGGVLALLEDREHRLWVGTEDGLNRLDRRCGCFQSYSLETDTSYFRQSYVALFEDHEGTIWTGSNGRLFYYDAIQDRFEEFAPFTGLPERLDETYISGIQQDAKGNLWVLAKNLWQHKASLYRIDSARQQVIHYVVSPSWGQVGPLLIDSQGRFWINAATPLVFPDDESRVLNLPPDVAPAAAAWALFEDSDGTIWTGTPQGIYRRPTAATEATLHPLVQNEHLSDVNHVRGFWEDIHTGTLLIGATGVYRTALPNARSKKEPAIPLVLTQIERTNRSSTNTISPYELDRLVLSPDDFNVRLTYAALTYEAPERVHYRYRLQGFDRSWIEAGTERQVRYANLPPGRYTFQIEATAGPGQPPVAPLALPIIVEPPWWQTWWFQAFAAVLLLGLMGGVYQARIRRVRAQERLHRSEAEAQRLAELDAAKNRFFANISHEFRTPLTVIMGTAEGLSEEARPIRHQAKRLLQLVNQLLDLSKLEAAQYAIHPEPGDLVAFLSSLVQGFQPLAERYDIALRLRTNQTQLMTAFDGDALEKVMTNLLSNALKFTPAGGKVWVLLNTRHRAVEHKKDGTVSDGVEIIVKDTGPGIPGEALPRIFTRFEQAETPSTHPQGGIGIGLALAKELVALQGGKLLVESEEGFGSAFTIWLPLPLEEDTQAFSEQVRSPAETWVAADDAVPLAPSTHMRPPSHAPTLLIIEDNAEVRTLLRSQLQSHYNIQEADNGEAGLALARTQPPDLILSDVMMPKLNGVALCRALKTDKKLQHLPIILLTAKADEASVVEGLEAGADDYITKPFHASALRAKVANLIDQRQRMREQFSKELIVKPGDVVVSSEEEQFLRHVLSLIEEQLGNSIFGVNHLADAVGLSRRQLTRRVKGATGEPPSDLIRRLRLERAAQLLAAEAGTISEIAYQVGFKSPSYFATAFRDHFGHSPSQHISTGT